MSEFQTVEQAATEKLRDYFAGLAMQALIAKTPLVHNPKDQHQPTGVSSGAYDYADAMLMARAA